MDQKLAIALPRNWPKQVKSAVLHAISLASAVFIYARARAATSCSRLARLQAELADAMQR